MSDIDWSLRKSILYWIYWLIPEVYYQLLSDIDWPAPMSIYSFLLIELAHKEHFMAKETCSHTSFFLQNVLTHVSQFLQNKFQTFSLTPLFLHNINMADIFFKWKSLNMFTHTINLHNTLPHWSQRKSFKYVHCSYLHFFKMHQYKHHIYFQNEFFKHVPHNISSFF